MTLRRFAAWLSGLIVLLAIAAPARADEYVFQNSWRATSGYSPPVCCVDPDPRGIHVFPGSYVYLTDVANDVVNRYTQSGSLSTYWGFNGVGNGNLNEPVGIATDGVGAVYVVDQANHRIQKFTSGNSFVWARGTTGSGNGQFITPHGIATDSVGNVYVTDSALNRVQKFDTNGNFVTAWGATGSGNGQFTSPEGIAVDSGGNVYVGESGTNKRIQKFNSSGGFLAAFGGPGSGPGQLASAPGLAVDAAGDVYVADAGNHRVQRFTPSGSFVEEIGESGSPFAGELSNPVDVAVDGSSVFVVERSNHYVYRYVKGGQVIVTLDTVPDGSYVQFDLGGGLSPTSAYLHDSPGYNKGTAAAPAGSGYSVTPQPLINPVLTDVSCSDGSDPSNISLSVGEVVDCSFTYKSRPTLTVVQNSQPLDAQDFTFHAGGGLNPATFVLDDDNFERNDHASVQGYYNLDPGTYSISQDTPAGWDPAQVSCTGGVDPAAIQLELGDSVSCTFTNAASDAGFVAFKLDTQPDSSQFFYFYGLRFPVWLNDDGTGTPGGSDPPNEGGMVMRAGTYRLSEAQLDGWRLTSATCSDGSPVWALDLQADENVTCTFVNQAGITGRVLVKLQMDPGDPQNVTFQTSGGLNGVQEPPTFQLSDPPGIGVSKTFFVTPGSGYGVSEQVPAGWDLTSSCSDGSSPSNIDVSSGETVTCTFLTRKRARLTIKQDTQPDDPQDFSYTATGGLSPSTFALDDDGNDGNGTSSVRTFDNLLAGSYSVTQQTPAGWSRYVGFCSDGSPIDQISLSGGEDLTCMVRNTRPGDPPPASSIGAGGAKAISSIYAYPESYGPELSADGRYVAYYSYAKNLDPADTEESADVFWRDLRTGEVRLVSRATGANGANSNAGVYNFEISADGRYVAFSTTATNLSPADGDSTEDVFVRDVLSNTTTLVSRASGVNGTKGSFGSSDPAISGDGRFVGFYTYSNLSPDDNEVTNSNASVDVYVRDLQSSTTTLVSRATGAAGANANGLTTQPSLSFDGRYVAFASLSTNLDPGDSDSTYDVFVRDLQANTTTLASRASGANGVNADQFATGPVMFADGSRVVFDTTADNLDPADTDALRDVYLRDLQSNTTTIVSRASGVGGTKADADSFAGFVSPDGRYVGFMSKAANLVPEPIVAGGTSIYLRDLQTDTTSLASLPTGTAVSTVKDDSASGSASSGARFVAFSSRSPALAIDDPAPTNSDVFVRDRQDNVTSLESRASPTYPRPKAATPVYASLVPAYNTCQSPNRQHASPLTFGSCSPPAQSSPRVTLGSPDANGQAAKSVGLLKTIVSPGNPSTPAEDADVQFTASITDVRNSSGLADYTGELEARIPLQVTDRINYPPTGGQGPGTTAPFEMSFAIPCTATGDTTVGATCAIVTTADTLLPGAVIESARAIWAYGQVSVYDGGSDSDADTQAGNSPFLRQGVFVP